MVNRKHLSQNVAFGLFRLLSLSVVGILFAILGFIIRYRSYRLGVPHYGSYQRYDCRWNPSCHCRYVLLDGGQCFICLSGGSDERYLYE